MQTSFHRLTNRRGEESNEKGNGACRRELTGNHAGESGRGTAVGQG